MTGGRQNHQGVLPYAAIGRSELKMKDEPDQGLDRKLVI